MKTESESHSVVSDSLRPHRLYSPWNSPGQNTGVGSLSLLQGIFPTQGSNPGLPHWRQILSQLSYKGSPRILEWVADPFSSRSSWPRNRTRVSCIVGRFFINWAIREAPKPVRNASSQNPLQTYWGVGVECCRLCFNFLGTSFNFLVMELCQPQVWTSQLYAGKQELEDDHQVGYGSSGPMWAGLQLSPASHRCTFQEGAREEPVGISVI